MIHLNFTPFPRLVTARTILREMKHEDVTEYHFIRADEEMNKYIGNAIPQSPEETIAIIDRMNNFAKENKSIAWTIADKLTDKMVGSICIWNMSGNDDTWELGYSLHTNHQGKGLMYEAVVAGVEYGFKVMNLPVINAHTHKDNDRSIRLLEKAGFHRNTELENDITDPHEKEILIAYSLYKK